VIAPEVSDLALWLCKKRPTWKPGHIIITRQTSKIYFYRKFNFGFVLGIYFWWVIPGSPLIVVV